MASQISYDRCTELLGKRIRRTISPAEVADVAQFEAAQPVDCPKCQTRVRSQFMPEPIPTTSPPALHLASDTRP